jgi:heat shock protein HslJ
MIHATAFAFLFVTLAACARTPEQEGDAGAPATITDRDWELVSVGELDNPRGMQDRPVTIRFDSAAARAAGFAGCNQFSAGYTLRDDSLSFDAPISTKMMCPDAMQVETSFLGALESVTRYEATDSTLTLHASSGVIARFRAASP